MYKCHHSYSQHFAFQAGVICEQFTKAIFRISVFASGISFYVAINSFVSAIPNKKLSCRREAARCFVFVCSPLQHTYSTVFLLPITAASDLLVHKIYYGLATRWWKMFKDIFIRFDATHERGRHTDRQTDGQTLHDSIGRAYAWHRAAKTSSANVNFDSFVVFMC